MSDHSESVLYASLTDVEALEQIAQIGIDPQVIPTEAMRDVVMWCLEYYHLSGRTKAPSREMLLEQWGKRLERARIELPDEDVEIDLATTAVKYLVAQYVHKEMQHLQREIAIIMASAEPHEVVDGVHAAADAFSALSLRVRDRTSEVEGIQGIQDSLHRYDQRAAAPRIVTGMSVGIPAVDGHTLGVHGGEIAVWAAPPKGAKSWSATHVAHTEWTRGREVVLNSLENSVPMSYDRLACQICSVDYRLYQKGDATEEDTQRVRDWLTTNRADLKDGFHLVSPEQGRRTPAAIIRHAQALGAKTIIIDQLSHIEHPNPSQRRPRNEVVRDIMMELAVLISTGRETVPLLLTAQINREGVAAAHRAGKLELQHLAESAEIERSASWVFGLMRSEAEVTAGMATLQMLASRRMDLKNWRLAFEPWYGIQQALGEASL
ncbi:DnaB-like helicase C-terminal domain-containing protein [Streptomyces sp. NPDC008079]|uniref:DnaB-like helicase C-terminal domain-containing protein n=1 Tax=Streptomyces sp. NPDC008079 TaxID=3364806 RepID=UPI0036EEBBC2